MESSWKSGDELFSTARRESFTAVAGDIMDQMSLLRRFLPPAIQPLREDMVVIGLDPLLNAPALRLSILSVASARRRKSGTSALSSLHRSSDSSPATPC